MLFAPITIVKNLGTSRFSTTGEKQNVSCCNGLKYECPVASGLKWRNIGKEKPTGEELENEDSALFDDRRDQMTSSRVRRYVVNDAVSFHISAKRTALKKYKGRTNECGDRCHM